MSADFPFARSLIVVRSERTNKKSGQSSTESRYYLSSQEAGEHTALQWLGLIRGHRGGVENRNHWRQDAKFHLPWGRYHLGERFCECPPACAGAASILDDVRSGRGVVDWNQQPELSG